MESSIWLLAFLYSRERRTELSVFLSALECLRAGEPLFSPTMFRRVPEMVGLASKHTPLEREEIRTELIRSNEKGYLLLYPGHPLFPKSYLHLEEVPYLLRLKGEPVWMTKPGLAVVGSREPSAMSKLWMDRHLTKFLDTNDCFTVSGGARGVDQKTHLLSLLTGRPTVVLVPAGLDRMYPSSLLEIESQILKQGGAFLSEYPDHQMMQKHYFVQRNRLISGLALGTVVIEARWKSGTMVTAQEAADQHKPIWVLPGHPVDPNFQGSLNLISEGASMLLDAEYLNNWFESEARSLTNPSAKQVKQLVEDLPTRH